MTADLNAHPRELTVADALDDEALWDDVRAGRLRVTLASQTHAPGDPGIHLPSPPGVTRSEFFRAMAEDFPPPLPRAFSGVERANGPADHYLLFRAFYHPKMLGPRFDILPGDTPLVVTLLPEMVLEPVESSHLAAAGYDEESKTLRVRFQNGAIYDYTGVPPLAYEHFLTTESQAVFVQRMIARHFRTEQRA